MIQTQIEAVNGAGAAVRDVLRSLLDKKLVDALLLPLEVPGGATAPTLVRSPAALDKAAPFAPVMPFNAARAAQALTITGNHQKLGLLLRSCEIRALVELVKFQQVKLDNALILGVDCLGTFDLEQWQAAPDKQPIAGELLAAAHTGQTMPATRLPLRSACQICEQPVPTGDHVALSFGVIGVDPGSLFLSARDDIALALGLPANDHPARRDQAVKSLIHARTAARDAAFAAYRSRVNSIDGLLAEFAPCIRCHNYMTNCPICYCRECIFRTPTFEHDSELLFQWADRKGSVRMLPDTLLFHLTRLNHMVSSCVGCGMCTQACPAGIDVGTVFRAVGEKVQALFDYHPGRSLAEAAPVQEFREDELKSLGERPH